MPASDCLNPASAARPTGTGYAFTWALTKPWAEWFCCTAISSTPVRKPWYSWLWRNRGRLSGDRFVIRYYSPVTTIGGGVVIDPRAPKQKRFREDVLEELSKKEGRHALRAHSLELENKPEEILTPAGFGQTDGERCIRSFSRIKATAR